MPSDIISPEISDYCDQHTHAEPALLRELSEETFAKASQPQMLCGHVEGRFLKLLVQLSGARRVLEIGMFTGYSALCMAEGLPDDGKLITCDIDEETSKIARRFFARSLHGSKITIKLQDALKTLRELEGEFDFVFIDADKENYGKYYEACFPKLRRGGLIVFDNSLWGGKVIDPAAGDPDTRAIVKINELLARDERVENVLLTVRDGMNLVRKM